MSTVNNVVSVQQKESILDKIITTVPKAPRITLYGKRGIGKSTFASKFPNPLFLLTEEPTLNNIQALPVVTHFLEFWKNVKELNTLENPPFKTLVIDSVSKLDALVVEYVMEGNVDKSGNKKRAPTLASAYRGYGEGFQKAQSIHRTLKMELDRFTNKGIALVFISHLALSKYKAPDMEDYDVHTIVMNNDRSREIYLDDVDMVGFCKQESYITSTDSGRNLVTNGDKRIISVNLTDANVSKTRYKMPDEINMEFTELAKYIPYYNQAKK
jgi:hypothetical protein